MIQEPSNTVWQDFTAYFGLSDTLPRHFVGMKTNMNITSFITIGIFIWIIPATILFSVLSYIVEDQYFITFIATIILCLFVLPSCVELVDFLNKRHVNLNPSKEELMKYRIVQPVILDGNNNDDDNLVRMVPRIIKENGAIIREENKVRCDKHKRLLQKGFNFSFKIISTYEQLEETKSLSNEAYFLVLQHDLLALSSKYGISSASLFGVRNCSPNIEQALFVNGNDTVNACNQYNNTTKQSHTRYMTFNNYWLTVINDKSNADICITRGDFEHLLSYKMSIPSYLNNNFHFLVIDDELITGDDKFLSLMPSVSQNLEDDMHDKVSLDNFATSYHKANIIRTVLNSKVYV